MRIGDMIISDSRGREKGFLDPSVEIDLDIGDTDDFEMTMSLSDYPYLDYAHGDRIYIPGTEYGGIIGDRETSAMEDRVTLRGCTWRGMLKRKFILPDNGNKTVSGEANAVIRELTKGWFGELMKVEEKDSGIQIGSYLFTEYVNGLTGITDMLKTVGARLEFVYEQEPFSGCVKIRAVPARDYSEDIEYSNDQKVFFTTRDYRLGINHLICISEETHLRVDLFIDENGNISETQTFFGADERADVYEVQSGQDKQEIMQAGMEKFGELTDYKALQMSVQDIEVAIGDIVGGRERITGLYMKQPVTGKILKLDSSNETIEYKVGE